MGKRYSKYDGTPLNPLCPDCRSLMPFHNEDQGYNLFRCVRCGLTMAVHQRTDERVIERAQESPKNSATR